MTNTTATLHDVRFPGETAEYRHKRDELLEAERALRRQTEAVAELRRALPLGGAVPNDYVFARAWPEESVGKDVRLSDLFGHHDTLIVYSFMFGPKMDDACPSCTSILDALDGQIQHVTQRTGFAVVAKSDARRISDFAAARGWRNLPLLSSADNTFNADYHSEDADGNQRPLLTVFVRRDGVIHHFTTTELNFIAPDEGQNERHVDTFWPLWNLWDFTPQGRGSDWYPALSYP